MISVKACVFQGRQLLQRVYLEGKYRRWLLGAAYVLGGFCFSAAALGGHMQPLAMAFTWACSPGGAFLAAAGGALGYWCFWPEPLQGILWVMAGLVGRLLVPPSSRDRISQVLLPASGAAVVALCGVCFQMLAGDDTPVSVYLLRVLLGGGATWLLAKVMEERNPVLDWLAWGLGVLALAQIAPLPYIGLGFVAMGALTVSQAFPAAALAGLALDLAQVSPVPMTAVAVLGYLVRFLPRGTRWLQRLAPAVVYGLLMNLRGEFDLFPVPGLVLGGILGGVLPGPVRVSHRRGETAVAQVRLEIVAGVLGQVQQLLLEMPQVPVDEDALILRAADRACSSCPARKNCGDCRRISQLPGVLLQKPLLHPEELPVLCRKSGRFLAELHRAQEQLRSIRADRERQQEYRTALIQQYQFLGDYLRDLSDRLANRAPQMQPFYTPQVQVCGNRPQADNGDRCTQFAGTMCKYYIVLCDGMGTGPGAVQEGKLAATMLRKLLSAGFPAEYALRSVNSLCALRDRAGAVTVDLAELELYTGKVNLYKWGAAPSYLVAAGGAEKIGTAGPPPGVSVSGYREQAHSLSLRRNQTLVMVSDGVPEEAAQKCCTNHADRSIGELARSILTCSQVQGQDDATVITIRLDLAGEKE